MIWRKGWDSNPRYPCRHAGFQDRCLKPLGHPSGANFMRDGSADCKRRLVRIDERGGRAGKATNPSPRPYHPISAAFALRYVDVPARRWAASGRPAVVAPDIGSRPAEWYLGRMGIRRSDLAANAVRIAAVVAACLVVAN